jgi:hypothetical protein
MIKSMYRVKENLISYGVVVLVLGVVATWVQREIIVLNATVGNFQE